MAFRVKVMKGLGAFMLLNNITTLISRGPRDTPQSEEACLSKYKDFATVVSDNVLPRHMDICDATPKIYYIRNYLILRSHKQY
ncbi:unnamed protein product, partial [Brenthis ino]